MSKGTINSLILISTTLALTACSSIFTKKSTAEATQIATEEVTEVQQVVENPTPHITEDPTAIVEENTPIEMPTIDSLNPVLTRPKFPPFTSEQSSKMGIAEYQNATIDDLAIDLTADNSHYPSDGMYITSPYGWRKGRMHTGIDIKVLKGDNIYAAFDGVVRMSKYYSAYGYCVILRHYNGLETLYAHCSKLLVDVDQEVKAGDVIALGGSTGRSTGSHLHFETRVKGQYFDPNRVIDTKSSTIRDSHLYITQRNKRLFVSNNDSEEEREAYILSELSIRYHTVRSGDVLSRIAVNNGTTVSNICRLNGISSRSTLRIGQRLIVRDGIKTPVKKTTTTTEKSSTTNTTSTALAKTTTNSGDTHLYTIRSGDTLSVIAQRNGTTISEICALNGITSRTTIRTGQKLRLPGKGSTTSSSQPTQTASSSASYHTIKSGDTLSEIAKKYGTTVTKLCAINGISANSTLRLGQKIKLSGASTSTSANTSASVPNSASNATYHTVRSGDTLSLIAQRNNTTITKLCSLNNITRRTVLQIGQKIRVR